MNAFTPSGIVTSEVCPVCGEPGVEVEHGYEADIDLDGNVKVDTARYRHLWHCPECGDELAWVVNCMVCDQHEFDNTIKEAEHDWNAFNIDM